MANRKVIVGNKVLETVASKKFIVGGKVYEVEIAVAGATSKLVVLNRRRGI